MQMKVNSQADGGQHMDLLKHEIPFSAVRCCCILPDLCRLVSNAQQGNRLLTSHQNGLVQQPSSIGLRVRASQHLSAVSTATQ